MLARTRARAGPASHGVARVHLHRSGNVRLPPALLQQRCRASAAGSPGGSPYEALGVPEGADSARVEQAYKMKKREAEKKGDRAEATRLEEAHNAIFMAALSSRLQGSGPVDKAIAKADRTNVVPWLPRVQRGDDFLTKLALAVYGAALLFELLLKSTPDGIINAAIVGVILNTWKQYLLFPAPPTDMQKRLDTGWGHIFRAALLTCLATLAGVIVPWTLPNVAADALNFTLPMAFQANQGAIATVGSMLCNLGTTLFLR